MADLNSLIIPKSNSSTKEASPPTSLESLIIPKKDTIVQDKPLPGDTAPIGHPDLSKIDNDAINNPAANTESDNTNWWTKIKQGLNDFIHPTLTTPPTAQPKDEEVAADKLKKNLEGQPSIGIEKPVDLTKTVANALDAAADIPSLHLPGVKSIGEGLAPAELQNLGYQLLPDKTTGTPAWQYKGTGNYTPDEISAKLTTIKSNLINQSDEVKSQIRDLDKSKQNADPTIEVTNPEDFKPMSKEQLDDITKQKEDKEKQLLDISDKYSDIQSVYKSIHNLQIQPLSSKDVTEFHDVLSNQPKDKPLDFNAINPSLENKLSAYQKYIETGMSKDSLTQRGMSYSYADDDYEHLKAQEALKNKGVKDAQINDWQYTGMQPDYQHAQGDLKVDSDILKQTVNSKNAILDEAKKKNIPIHQVQDYIDKLGINHTIDLLTQVITLEKQATTSLTGQVDSDLKGLIKYKAVTDEYDRWRTEAPATYGFFHTLNAESTGMMLNSAKYLRHLANVFTPGTNLSEQFNYENREQFSPLFYEAQENKEITSPTFPKAFVGQAVPEIPGETEKVPFTQKGSNLQYWGIGNIISGDAPNWDVTFHNFNKSVIDFSPFLAGGEIEGVVKEVIEGARGVQLGAALEEGGGLGYKYTAAKAALSTLPKLTGVILPGMLAFGPENFDRERLNKSLTITQQNVLATVRTFIESAAFLTAPSQMLNASERMVAGELINPLEDDGYKAAVEKTLFDRYGTKFSDKALRYIFDITTAGAKAYGKTALDLSTQMNLALIGDDIASRMVRATVNKNYYDPTREASLKNIYDTTTSALATALPFSLFHMIKGAMDGEFNTQFARESALYRVAQSPEYYLSHISDRMERGEITKEEALRQTSIINQAEALHLSLKGEHNRIDKLDISDDEKSKLKFALFQNKVREQGISETLTKAELERESALEKKIISTELTKEGKSKIEEEAFQKYDAQIQEAKAQRDKAERGSPEEKVAEEKRISLVNQRDAEAAENIAQKEKEAGAPIEYHTPKPETLLDYLDRSAAEGADIRERIKHYENLPYEEKLKYDAKRETQNVINQITEATTPEQMEQLRDEIHTKREDNSVSKNQNPYLDELYERAENHLDLKISDEKYKDAHTQEADINQQALSTGEENTTETVSYEETPPSPTTTTVSEVVKPKEEIKEEVANTEEPSEPKESKIVPYLNSHSILITDGTQEQFQVMVGNQIAKLTEIETKATDLGGGNEGNLLVFASPLLGYKARESTEGKDGHKNTNDTIDPKFIELHKPEFGIGTAVSFRVNPEVTTYSKAAQNTFAQNKDVYISGGHLTEQEFNTILNNPNNFKEIEVLDEKGNIIGNIHSLDYIRPDRVVEYVGKPGEEESNLAPNIHSLVENRATIFDRHKKGQHLNTQVDSKGYGTPAIRADEQYVPFTQAIKDKGVQNSLMIVNNPKDTFHKGNLVVNWKYLIPGQVGAIVPTPNGKHFFLPLMRTKLSGDWNSAIITALKFYREYNREQDPSKKAELDKFAEDLIGRSHDVRHNIDIRTNEGLRSFISSIISLSKTSDFTGANLSDDTRKSIPFIDIADGSITFSEARRNYEKLSDDEKNAIKGDYKKLQSVGVNRYSLIGSPDSAIADMEARLNTFLPKRSLNIRNDFFEGAKDVPFEIPIPRINNGKYEINENPSIKNSGKDYPDFVKNNTSTNNLEIPTGGGQHTYFVQPNIGFDITFGEKEPEPPTETEEEKQKRETHEFIDKFKDVKDVNNARELAKEGEKFPILADWINARIKHLEKEEAIEAKYGGEKGHNKLARLKSDYNTLSDAKKSNKAGRDILRQIHQISGDLGYTLKTLPGGNLEVKTKEGKNVRQVGVGSEVEPIIEGKYEAYGEAIDKEEALRFQNESKDYAYQGSVARTAWKIGNAGLKRGFEQIEKGELNKPAAQRILDKIAEWKSQKNVDFITGRGKHAFKESRPYDEIAQVKKWIQEIDNKEYTEEELNEGTRLYDEMIANLSEEQLKQAEKYAEEESRINQEGEDADSGLAEENEQSPPEEEIRQQVEDYYSAKTPEEIEKDFEQEWGIDPTKPC